MSIARLSYVMCDGCGGAAGAADDATEARQLAASEGFAQEGRSDLCRFCKVLPVAERPWVKEPPIVYENEPAR